MIVGIKKRKKEIKKKERLPIIRNILLQLLNQLNTRTELQTIIHTAYCLVFVAFLCVREFTYSAWDAKADNFASWHLTRGAIDFQSNRLMLFFPASKTDCFRARVAITVAVTKNSACTVILFKKIFNCFSKHLSSPLFHLTIDPFTKDYLTAKLRSDIKRLGIRGNFSSHSFKRGMATTAERN